MGGLGGGGGFVSGLGRGWFVSGLGRGGFVSGLGGGFVSVLRGGLGI